MSGAGYSPAALNKHKLHFVSSQAFSCGRRCHEVTDEETKVCTLFTPIHSSTQLTVGRGFISRRFIQNPTALFSFIFS